jgi:hypothetical protein
MAKRGSDKRIAAALSEMSETTIDNDVRDMVGKLELNASLPTDYFFLRELYSVLKGKAWGGGGRIIIYDKEGKKVEDWLSFVNDECQCKGRTHSKVCPERWNKENKDAGKKSVEETNGN